MVADRPLRVRKTLVVSPTMPNHGDPSALRRAVDAAIGRFLAGQRVRIGGLAPASAALIDMIEEVLAVGGKRLRPLLCALAYQAAGGPDSPEILTAAGSLELLHTFAILHDDVMDQALVRRGRPALHRRLAAERRAAGHPDDADAYGVSVAVLAGDLALVLSDAMMAGSGFPKEAVARAMVPLEEMRVQAVAGQYLDILKAGVPLGQGGAGGPAGGPAIATEEAARIGRLKTAGYSVGGPIGVGTALAGATPGVRAALERYGAAVGEAFFLHDELIGLFADQEETGKDAESDLRRGKPTTLIADALARATPDQRAALHSRWGNPQATLADLAAVREAVEASGARKAAAAAIGDRVDEATAALEAGGLLAAPAGRALAALAAGLG